MKISSAPKAKTHFLGFMKPPESAQLSIFKATNHVTSLTLFFTKGLYNFQHLNFLKDSINMFNQWSIESTNSLGRGAGVSDFSFRSSWLFLLKWSSLATASEKCARGPVIKAMISLCSVLFSDHALPLTPISHAHYTSFRWQRKWTKPYPRQFSTKSPTQLEKIIWNVYPKS